VTDETLAVVPAGLIAAAQLIAEQAAALSIPCGRPGFPAERAGTAAIGLYHAFDDYRRNFSARLAVVSEAMLQMADSYTGTDTDIGAVLDSVGPP
jgi:hypothetical protein